MMFDIQRQRSMNDLLSAERSMREKNEAVIHEYQNFLVYLAVHFDGQRYQDLQHGDPHIPAKWTTADWKTFFDAIQISSGWNAPEIRNQREMAELKQQVEVYKAKVTSLEKQLKAEQARQAESGAGAGTVQPDHSPDKKSKAMPRPALSILLPGENEATPPLETIIKDVQSILPHLPRKTPAPFEEILDGGNRTGANLDQAFSRYWIMMYLLGRWKLSTWLETDRVVSATSIPPIKPGAGSMHRIMDDLIGKNLVVSETIHLPYTSLALHRLSSEGEQLFEAIFHAKPVENEWARINRLHQGEREPQHTMAIIVFAIHARARGYSTRILPENKQTSTPPDLWISRGAESLYVEVELSEKESPVKWKNQAMLNNGKVAICAGNLSQHEMLVSDCKAMHLTGYATNLEAVVKTCRFYEINSETPLWMEVW